MSPVEAAVNNLQTQISALQKQKAALQRQARSQHQYQPQVAAQPRNPAQQFYQQDRRQRGPRYGSRPPSGSGNQESSLLDTPFAPPPATPPTAQSVAPPAASAPLVLPPTTLKRRF